MMVDTFLRKPEPFRSSAQPITGVGTLVFADSYIAGFFPRTTNDVFVRAKDRVAAAPFYSQWWQVNSTAVNYNWDASRSFHISTSSNSGWDLLAAWYDGQDVVYKTSVNNTMINFRIKPKSTFIRTYPNPASAELIVEGAHGLDYSLRDVAGRNVAGGTVPETGRIDLASLQSAIYLLQLTHADGSTEVFKINKQ